LGRQEWPAHGNRSIKSHGLELRMDFL